MDTAALVPEVLGASASWWALVWPALVVAVLRVSDVTVNVLKTISVVNGRRGVAAAFAALESAIWLSAAGIVLADLTPARFAGFVLGVAAGTWIGMAIVAQARIGLVTIRAFVGAGHGRELAGHIVAERIRQHGHRATLFEGYGQRGEVHMILSVVKRRDARAVVEIIERADPQAFVAVDDHASGFVGSIGHARV